MPDLSLFDLKKAKRQIEIVGLSIQNHSQLRPVDLAVMYGCEELTIKRDLHDLRCMGIAIHSTKRKGVALDRNLDAQSLKHLISQYLAMVSALDAFDTATNLVVKKLGQQSLAVLVTLQRCIETRTAALVEYEATTGRELQFEICPLKIFRRNDYWRVLAVNEGKMKQYHIMKFRRVTELDRQFRRPSEEEIENVFRYSFRSWIGSDRFSIKLKLSEPWVSRLRPMQVFEDQRVVENADGTAILEATVNSLAEVATWVVSRGKGVRVLEPAGLRALVIQMAKDALSNYE